MMTDPQRRERVPDQDYEQAVYLAEYGALA